MPGIYINDGGATGSGLASAIGQIAANYSPVAQAQATELGQRIEAENWSNREASNRVRAEEQGTLGAAQYTTQLGADLPNQQGSSGSGGGVPGAIAASAQPGDQMIPAQPGRPWTQRNTVSTAGYGPLARMEAGRYAQGAPMTELIPAINYGIDVTKGPGADPTTQTELTKARGMPQIVNAGQDYILNPAATAAGDGTTQPAPAARTQGGGGANYTLNGGDTITTQPGSQGTQPTQTASNAGATQPGVIHGPSVYTKGVQEARAQSDPADFKQDLAQSQDASQNLHLLEDIAQLYNGAGLDSSIAGQVNTNIQQWLANNWHVTVSDKQGLRQEIAKRLGPLMASMRGPMGIQRMTNADIQLLSGQLADGTMQPKLFNDLINASRASLTQQQQAGDVAQQYLANPAPTMNDAADALNAKMNIYKVNPFDAMRQGYPTYFHQGSAGGGGGGGSNAPPAPRVGDMQNGYRYLGGDPGQPTSWQKAQ